MNFPGTISVSNADLCSDLSQDKINSVIDAMIDTILNIECTANSDGLVIQDCTISIRTINCQSPSELASGSSLVFEYEIIIESICNADCSNAQAVANKLYGQVTAALLSALSDGSFADELRQASSTAVSALLANAKFTGDFGPVVIPLLSLLSEWYPDWRGQSNKCKNDGNAPAYMKAEGSYYEESLADCCERYFSWDYYTCTGTAESIPNGFYPDWAESGLKCLNSTEAMPNYMRKNPDLWLQDDVESCCRQYFRWSYGDCVTSSGGSLSAVATGKWYVNNKEEICQQDCPEGDGAACGGNANAWDTLYSTAASCCEEKLSWIAKTVCESESTKTTNAGSSLWFVDWTLDKVRRSRVLSPSLFQAIRELD